jgi:hypothetical protein
MATLDRQKAQKQAEKAVSVVEELESILSMDDAEERELVEKLQAKVKAKAEREREAALPDRLQGILQKKKNLENA